MLTTIADLYVVSVLVKHQRLYILVCLSFFMVVNVAITSFSYLSTVKGMCWDNTICSETVQTKQEADGKRRITCKLDLVASFLNSKFKSIFSFKRDNKG